MEFNKVCICLDLWKHGFSECLKVLFQVCPWYQDFDPPHPGQWVTVCTSHWALQLSWSSFLAEAWFSWLRQIKTKVLASERLHWTLLLTEGVVSKQPPPKPTSFDPKAWTTHPLLGQSLGYPAVPTKTPSPLLFWTLGCARRQAKT